MPLYKTALKVPKGKAGRADVLLWLLLGGGRCKLEKKKALLFVMVLTAGGHVRPWGRSCSFPALLGARLSSPAFSAASSNFSQIFAGLPWESGLLGPPVSVPRSRAHTDGDTTGVCCCLPTGHGAAVGSVPPDPAGGGPAAAPKAPAAPSCTASHGHTER